jgi:cytochrome c peroxidase
MHLKFNNKILLFFTLVFIGCEKDIPVIEEYSYIPSPYILEIPFGFPEPEIPSDNPLTKEGVELGKKLFFDPILSQNNTHSCASCHFQSNAFSDPNQFSFGVDGAIGDKNASALVNIAWNTSNFWDGRAITLEEQAFNPITNTQELHSSWREVVTKIKNNDNYRSLFLKAFNTFDIDSNHVVKAIAQFERTLISGNSKYDKFVRNEINLTTSELRGLEIFNSEKGDCFHCHSYPLFTSNDFHNNGLDPESNLDEGRKNVTNDPFDKGKFKSPSLRNIELSAPYMHDGRFSTLEQVIEHYNFGGHKSLTIDPLMKKVEIGLGLTSQNKIDLINFLKTLTDSSFINNNNFKPNS